MAVPVALAGVGWQAVAAIVLAVVIVVAAVCWAIADVGRARRLATLIRAWRGAATQPVNRGRALPSRREQRRPTAGRTG
jgi:hypothetical protein